MDPILVGLVQTFDQLMAGVSADPSALMSGYRAIWPSEGHQDGQEFFNRIRDLMPRQALTFFEGVRQVLHTGTGGTRNVLYEDVDMPTALNVQLAGFSTLRQSLVALSMCSRVHNSTLEVDVLESRLFTDLPRVLQINLGRFGFDEEQGAFKINNRLAITRSLDLDFMCEDKRKSQGGTRYVLFAVQFHEGDVELGHFWTCSWTSLGWLKFNDRLVSPMTETEVLDIASGAPDRDCSAYTLFYVREDICDQMVTQPAENVPDLTGGEDNMSEGDHDDDVDASHLTFDSVSSYGGSEDMGSDSDVTFSESESGPFVVAQLAAVSAIMDDDFTKLLEIVGGVDSIAGDRLIDLGRFILPRFLCGSPTWTGVSAFFNAVDCVTGLLSIGRDLNVPDQGGITAVGFAAAGGRFPMWTILANAGVDFSEPILQGGLYPAEIAAFWGRYDMLIWLATKGFLRGGRDPAGFKIPAPDSPCQESRIVAIAAGNGHLEVVRFLIGDLRLPVNEEGDYPLSKRGSAVHSACREGHPSVLRLLADSHADLVKPNRLGETPLWLAVQAGSVECVREMISRGVPMGQADAPYLETVVAAGKGRLDILKALACSSAFDPHAIDADGVCPLVAAVCGHNFGCAKWLAREFGFPPEHLASLGKLLAEVHDLELAVQALDSCDIEDRLGLSDSAKRALWDEAKKVKWIELISITRFREHFRRVTKY
jgi:hypothetical protein